MFRAIYLFIRHYVAVPVTIVFCLACLLFAGMVIPKVSWLWGMSGLDSKMATFAQAVYWSARVKFGAGDTAEAEPDKVVYGDIVRLSKDGRMVLLIPEAKRYVPANYAVANIQMVGPDEADAASRMYRGRSVRAEIYGDAAIVWDGDKMVNLALIADGAARPDPEPPSPAYHQIFAEHLWTRLRK